MATAYTCPYKDECDTDCSQDEVGAFLRPVVNPRSRQLLSILETHEGDKIPLDDILNELPLGDDDRQNWHINLYHSNLPMLEELGIVEFDRTESTVRYLGCPLITEQIDVVKRG